MKALSFLSVLGFAAVLVCRIDAAGQPIVSPDDVNAMTMEVAALQTLRDLDLTPAQLTALEKIAKDAGISDRERKPGKVSPAYRMALRSLRDALRRGDEEHAAQFREKLDALQEKEEPALDAEVQVAPEARAQAAAALHVLNVHQLGTFVGTLELADPAELLATALDTVRGLKGEEKNEEMGRVAKEIGWLVGGSDEEAANKAKEAASKLLERAGAIGSQQQFKLQQNALEVEARQIVGEIDNVTLMTHSLALGMAELLSNPRLESALRYARISRPVHPDPRSSSGKRGR